MNLSLLAGPIIGGVIGYFTNYIAVKMLFRPLRPVKIGNYTLPFTPGIIPKGRTRIGKAIGDAVGQNLLTQDSLKEALLSEDMKKKIQSDVKDFLVKQQQNHTTLKENALGFISEEEYVSVLEKAENKITDIIVDKLDEMDVGTIIAREGIKAIKEKVGSSFIGMMINDSLIESMSAPIADAINVYIEENGQVVIYTKVSEECDKFSESEIKELVKFTDDFDIVSIFMKGYESLVENELSKLVTKINISSIIEKKIDEMDVLELEELVLSVMKKELSAVVNLGAIIGFILGIVNIFF